MILMNFLWKNIFKNKYQNCDLSNISYVIYFEISLNKKVSEIPDLFCRFSFPSNA